MRAEINESGMLFHVPFAVLPTKNVSSGKLPEPLQPHDYYKLQRPFKSAGQADGL